MAKTPKRTSSREDDELPGLKDVSEIHRKRSTVLYGRSGTGKTTLAASWPKPILYLDIRDEGTDSIRDVENIKVKEITSVEDIEEVRDWLLRGNHKKFKTLVIDTMSQLQEIYVEEQAANPKKKLRGSEGKRAGDFGTLTKQDWGQVASAMKSLIIDLRDLPMEVVFIAQDRTFNFGDETDEGDENALAPEVGPRLMPSVASVLNAAVGNIGNTFIRIRYETRKDKDTGKKLKPKKVTEYCLRVGASSTYVTKIRKPKGVTAPDFIVDPDYEDILDIIEGND